MSTIPSSRTREDSRPLAGLRLITEEQALARHGDLENLSHLLFVGEPGMRLYAEFQFLNPRLLFCVQEVNMALAYYFKACGTTQPSSVMQCIAQWWATQLWHEKSTDAPVDIITSGDQQAILKMALTLARQIAYGALELKTEQPTAAYPVLSDDD